jgi:hypothetical protein
VSISSEHIVGVDHMIVRGLFGNHIHELMAIATGLTSEGSVLPNYINKWCPKEVIDQRPKWQWSLCTDNNFLHFVQFMVSNIIREHPRTGPFANAMKW